MPSIPRNGRAVRFEPPPVVRAAFDGANEGWFELEGAFGRAHYLLNPLS